MQRPSCNSKPPRAVPALGGAVVLCAALCFWTARARGGDPIEFTPASGGVFVTNFNKLVSPDESRALKDKLNERQLSASKFLKSAVIMPSLPPPPGAPRMSAAAARRQRELRDKEKNWAFTMDEELQKADLTTAETMKLVDPKNVENSTDSQSAMERYFNRTQADADAKDRTTDSGDAADSANNGSDGSANGKDPKARDLAGAGSALRSLLESAAASSDDGGQRELLPFDRGEAASSFASPAAQRARMADFRALLEGRSTVSAAVGDQGASPTQLGTLSTWPSGANPAANLTLGALLGASTASPLGNGYSPPPPPPTPAAPPPPVFNNFQSSPLRMMGTPPPVPLPAPRP